jgi:hypoxanthine-guanine phosphoribosyltransferase
LCGEVAVAGGDAEEDAVEFFEDGWVLENGDRRVLGRRVHLVEDVLREGLGDSVVVSLVIALDMG